MKRLVVGLVLSSACAFAALSETPIKILNAGVHGIPSAKIAQYVKDNFNVDQYREVRAQVIYNAQQEPDHVLVQLLAKGYHKVTFASVDLDTKFNFVGANQAYRLQDQDKSQQPGTSVQDAACPDSSVQFISFCPNDIKIEVEVTKQVHEAATKAGLKSVLLLQSEATRDAYLNYMSCPNLKGNFYDGDSDPSSFITNDGLITAEEMSNIFKDKWNYKVTNIWLACQAYNAPMLPAVQDDAQSRKYAAGINDLQVGPSDKAAACTMEAAVQGKPMKASFDECYKKLDVPSDHWGFGGKGTDNFND